MDNPTDDDCKWQRLFVPRCPDEPALEIQHFLYQIALEEAYAARARKDYGEVYATLMKRKHLQKSLYQRMRTELLLGEYFRDLDAVDTSAVVGITNQNSALQQDLLGRAIEHFSKGADIARQIGDLVAVTQFKSQEAGACFGSRLFRKRLRPAFDTSKTAWDAWQQVSDRDGTREVAYEFRLADDLAVRAVVTGEFEEARKALNHAVLRLVELRERADFDPGHLANNELFILWDFAVYHFARGSYREAFRFALRARRKTDALLEPINTTRLPRLIAAIALACAEDAIISGYSRKRLLNVAEAEVDEARLNLERLRRDDRDDPEGHALILLAEAKWMGLSKYTNDRVEKIEEARRIAYERNDLALLAQADIAMGDEYFFQRKKREAKSKYLEAERNMLRIQFGELAHLARYRYNRLARPTPSRTRLDPGVPPAGGDISPN